MRSFSLLTFVLFLFLTIGHSAVDSPFMAYAGGKMIPHAWLVLALLAIPFTPLFARLSATHPPKYIFYGLLAFGLVMITGMRIFAGHTEPNVVVVYYALKELYCLFLLSFFWTYLNGFLDSQQAKRFIPILAAVWSLGDFVGGRITGLLAKSFGAPQLFIIWGVGTLLLIPFIESIERSYSRAAPPTGKPFKLQIAPLLRRIRSTPLLAGLTLTSAGALAVAIAMRYRYYDIFGKAFPSVEDGAAFLGNIRAYASVFKFGMGLFILPRLVYYFGVRNVLVIYPVAVFAALTAVAWDPGLGSASFAFFVAVGMNQALYEPTLSLTFNLLSPGERTALRTFFSGIMNPVGAVIIGVLLLLVSANVLPKSVTPAITLTAAAVFLGAVWLVRKSYVKSVLRGLQLAGGGFFDRMEQGPLPKEWAAELESRWLPASPDEKIVIMEFFEMSDDKQPFFLAHALSDPSASVRAAAFRRARKRWPMLPEQVLAGLRDAEAAVRTEAARYAGSSGFEDVDALLPLMHDTDAGVRAEAAVSVWSLGDLSHVSAAVAAMDNALHGPPEVQIAALRAFGRLGDPKYLRTLLAFSTHPDQRVRNAAAKAANQMAAPAARRWVDALTVWLRHSRKEERHDLESALKRIGGPAAARALLDEAAAIPASGFFRLRDALIHIGADAVSPSLSALTDRSRPLEVRILALSALNRLHPLNRRLLLQLVHQSLSEAMDLASRAQALSGGGDAAGEVLRLLYEEKAQVARTFVIRCLFAWNRYHGVRWVEQGIRSRDRAQRANATEALLNLTPANLRGDMQRLLTNEGRGVVSREVCVHEALSQPGLLWQEAAKAALAGGPPKIVQTV